jgi:hypothetical protein
MRRLLWCPQKEGWHCLYADMHAAEGWKFCPLEEACQYGEFDTLSKK